MNHIYRVVYNTTLACYQVVGELGKSKKKQRLSHTNSASSQQTIFKLRPLSYSLTLALLGLISPNLFAAPQGGNVVAGNAEIQQQHNITNIQQASQRAVINWQGFDVAKQETVNFHQPNNQAVTLNRVIGQQKSVIDGAINANGHVFIQNEKGVLIGKEAQINVGGLVATTQQIDNDKFMQGQYQFSGNAQGTVENLGNIQVPKGGVVALIAPIVKNSGNITALNADVLLASAEQFRLTLPQDGFAYTLDKGTLEGLVENKGAIIADGGHIILTAKGVSAVKKSVINHSGLLQANTVVNKNGVIELLGDLDNSELHFSGTIKAEAPEQGDGGLVETSAAKLHISEKANVSTQAKNGKTGKWVIDPKDFIVAESGGDMTGQQVSNALNSNDVELRSRSGAKEGRGDVIINDRISWDRNTLTLNADADITINRDLLGSGTAKLKLYYGQATASGIPINSDGKYRYDIDRTAKVDLPAGQNFITKVGRASKERVFTVLAQLPDQDLIQGDYIALGNDLTLDSAPENGWREEFKVFDGLGHTITGLANKRGLFYSVSDAELSHLHLDQVDITINEGGVGGLINSVSNSTIKNIFVSGQVRNASAYNIGGVIGYASNSDFENINFEGEVNNSATPNGIAGGIIGTSENSRWTNIHASGMTKGWIAGGLIGEAINSDISYASSDSIVEGDSVGGAIGRTKTSLLDKVYATGKVISKTNNSRMGGLIGFNNFNKPTLNQSGYVTTTIQRSYATNSLHSENSATRAAIGGLIGQSGDVVIQDSYSSGDIFSDITNTYGVLRQFIGGIIGETRTNSNIVLNNNYSTRKVTAPNAQARDIALGGLVGELKPATSLQGNGGIYDQDKIKTSKNIGLAKSSDEMLQKATYTDFFNYDDASLYDSDASFDSIWRIVEGTATPYLRDLTQGKIIVSPTTIEKSNASVQANNLSKTYDGVALNTQDDLAQLSGWSGAGVTVTGLQNSDTLNNSDTFTGTLKFDGEGSTWQGAVNVGNYTIVPYGLASQFYEIEYVRGNLRIDPRSITLQGRKEYDGSRNVSADKTTVLAGVIEKDRAKLGVTGHGTVVNENVGKRLLQPLAAHQFALTGEAAKNYRIDLTQSFWNITPKQITTKPFSLQGTRIYDGTRTVSIDKNTQLSGVLTQDIPYLNISGNGTIKDKDVGRQPLVSHNFSISGNAAANYQFDIQNSYWDITPRLITSQGQKVYDDTRTVTIDENTQLSGVLTQDIPYLNISGNGTIKDKDVGRQPLVSHNFSISGNAAANYQFDMQNSYWDITPKKQEPVVIPSDEKEPTDKKTDTPIEEIKPVYEKVKIDKPLEYYQLSDVLDLTLPVSTPLDAHLHIRILDKNNNVINDQIVDSRNIHTLPIRFYNSLTQNSIKGITHQSTNTSVPVAVPAGGQVKFTYNSALAKTANFVPIFEKLLSRMDFIPEINVGSVGLPKALATFMAEELYDELQTGKVRLVTDRNIRIKDMTNIMLSVFENTINKLIDSPEESAVKLAQVVTKYHSENAKIALDKQFLEELQEAIKRNQEQLARLSKVINSTTLKTVGSSVDKAFNNYATDLSKYDYSIKYLGKK